MTAQPAEQSPDPRRVWFDAAFAILAQEGYGALKLGAVCSRVGVTTGGFYHRFDSWSAFTSALLEGWRHDRTTAVGDLAADVADPVERLAVLAASAVGLEHGAEAAIRVWSRVDPHVGRVQEQVDQQRFEIVLDAARELVGVDQAHLFAAWAYSVLVGYEQLSPRFSPDDLAWSLDQVLTAARRVRDPGA